MDQSITNRAQTEAERLLAHHPSTKHLTIPMVETPHSNQVAAFGYLQAEKTLRVRFKWGNSEYDYHHVELPVVAAFAEAKSKGGFLKERIKGVFHYEKIKERDEVEQPRSA